MQDNDDWFQRLQIAAQGNVSLKLLKSLKKLALRKKDLNDFIRTASLLCKFNKNNTFLEEFHNFWKDKSDKESSTAPNITTSNLSTTSTGTIFPKRKINLTFDDDDEDDEIQLRNKIKPKNATDPSLKPQIKFKQITKSRAQSMKEYSDSGNLDIDIKINKNIITRPSPEKEDSKLRAKPEQTFKNNSNDDHILMESFAFDRNDIAPINDSIHSTVKLFSLPINQRKNWLPPFLLNYVNGKITKATIVGSLTESSQLGLINPFKNPESEFSKKARQGSKTVNWKRSHNEHAEQNKQNLNVSNSKIGNVMGIKNDTPKETDFETSINTKENTPLQIESTQDQIQNQRKSLPAYKLKDQIIQLVNDNQICIIIGETGSGKTTQLAQFLYENGMSQNGKLIGVTQPRRMAAMSVARRVATEMNVTLGQEVGYSIRFDDETSSKTRIKFMTDGILLRETLLDPLLLKYNCIIIDEAHERSLNTDILMGIFKKLLCKRNDLKLIITSATMNARKFSLFFGNAIQFTIPGRTFPVQINYTQSPVDDYVEATVKEAVRIHCTTSITSGDILIFMTGQEDIEVTLSVIKERLLEVYSKRDGIVKFDEIDDIEIYPIYSALPPNLQLKIFKKLDNSKRKIVIATNIAETSLTIDGIKYVIDCGYSKLKVFNAKIGLDSLAITPISQANANQRSGRAGRTGPGICYRLFTEETMDNDMYQQSIPEIKRTNLSNTILLLKSLGIEDVLGFPFIDQPPLQTLLASLYELWFNGALDNFGKLTYLGKQMSNFPLPPSLSKILLVSAQNGCSEDMLTIVSMLSIPTVFSRPKDLEKESDQARARFFVPESDHLTLLNVYSQWKSNKFSSYWCQQHFLTYKSLLKAKDIREQLVKIMKKNQIPILSSGKDWNIIRKCICSGFTYQAAKVTGLGKYVNLRTGMPVTLHPTSALFGLGDPPQYVIYNELLMTTKEYICCVTAVDPFWLMDFGSLIYDIRYIKEDKSVEMGTLFSHHIKDFDVDDSHLDKEKDEIDRRIDRCFKRRDEVIDKINKDQENTQTILTDKNNHDNKNVSSSRTNVIIGLKRRRPF